MWYYPDHFNHGTSVQECRNSDRTEHSFSYESVPFDSYYYSPSLLVMKGEFGRVRVMRNELTPEDAEGVRFDVKQEETRTRRENGKLISQSNTSEYSIEIRFGEWYDFPLPSDYGLLEMADSPECEIQTYGGKEYDVMIRSPGFQPYTTNEYVGGRGTGDVPEEDVMLQNCKWGHGFNIFLKATGYTNSGQRKSVAKTFSTISNQPESQNSTGIPMIYSEFYKALRKEVKGK